MQDQQASGRADDPIVLDDDDDDELQAVLAMSKAEAELTPRKRARSETPDEERRQIAEYVQLFLPCAADHQSHCRVPKARGNAVRQRLGQ